MPRGSGRGWLPFFCCCCFSLSPCLLGPFPHCSRVKWGRGGGVRSCPSTSPGQGDVRPHGIPTALGCRGPHSSPAWSSASLWSLVAHPWAKSCWPRAHSLWRAGRAPCQAWAQDLGVALPTHPGATSATPPGSASWPPPVGADPVPIPLTQPPCAHRPKKPRRTRVWPVEKHLGTFQTRFAGTAALPGGTSVNIPGLAAPSLLPARDFGGYGGCGAFPGRERLVSASSQPRSLARRHGAAPPFAFCRIKNVEASGIRRLAASLRRRNGFHEALNPSPTPPPQKRWGKKRPPAAWVGLGPL